jgi:tetratricopeptide (TPR) repeat protein
MRCLSIRQPWAWAICAGLKTIENRSWSNDYRGPVAIHAGASKETIKQLQADHPDGTFPWDDLAYGAIVGVAELVDVAVLNEALEADDSASGPYCWIFSRPRLFGEPIVCRGKLQLFFLEDDLAARLEQALTTPAAAPGPSLAEAYRQSVKSSVYDRCDWRMHSYADLGQFPDALRQCSIAIDAGAEESYFYRARGALHVDLGNAPAAIDDCGEAIRLDPQDGNAYYVRALAYKALDRTQDARADCRRAVELNPGLAELVVEEFGAP